MWRAFFADQYGTTMPPVAPHWCSYEALGLAMGRVTVMGKPGRLHPRAMDPKWVPPGIYPPGLLEKADAIVHGGRR